MVGIYFLFILTLFTTFFSQTEAMVAQHSSKVEKTLAIIKPFAYKKSAEILQIIKRHKFKIVAMKKMKLSSNQAEQLYYLCKQRPLFAKIVKYISSGPVVVMMLEKENAIKDWRTLIGAPDPQKAAQGTLRYMFSKSKVKNAAHGSDSLRTAQEELHLFFPELV